MTEEEREKLKVEEIKFVTTNSFFNESFNEYLSEKKRQTTKKNRI